MKRNNETWSEMQDRVQDEMIAATRRIEANRKEWFHRAIYASPEVFNEIIIRLDKGALD